MADDNKMNHNDDDLEFDMDEFDTDAFEAEDLEIDEFEAEDIEAMDDDNLGLANEAPDQMSGNIYEDNDDALSMNSDPNMAQNTHEDLDADLVEEYSDSLEGELDDTSNAFYDDVDDAQWDEALDNMDDIDGLGADDMSMDSTDPAAASTKKGKKGKKGKKAKKMANDGDNAGRKKVVSAAFWGIIAVVVGGGLYAAFGGGSSSNKPAQPSRPAPATQDVMDPSNIANKATNPAQGGGLLNDPTRLSARAGITPETSSDQGTSLLSNIGIPQPGAPENTSENTNKNTGEKIAENTNKNTNKNAGTKSQDNDIGMIAPDTMPKPQAKESTRRALPSETIPRANNVAIPDVPKVAPPKVDTAQLPSNIVNQGDIRVALDPNNPIIKNLQVDIAQLKSQDKNLDVKMSDISKQIMTLQDTLNRQIDVLKTSAAGTNANTNPAIDPAQITAQVTQQVSKQISQQLSDQLTAIQNAANQAAAAAAQDGESGNAAALNQVQLSTIQQSLSQLTQRLDSLEDKITGVDQDMAGLKQLTQDAKLAADQARMAAKTAAESPVKTAVKSAAKSADTMALNTSSSPSTQPVVTASLAQKSTVKKAPRPSYAPKITPPAPSFKPNAPARFAKNTNDKLNQVVNSLGQSNTSQIGNHTTSLYPATLSGQNAGRGSGAPYGQQQRASAQDFWLLRAAQRGRAWVSPVSNRAELKEITLGDTVQGLGRVTSIEKINGQWVVQGTLSILQ